MRAVCLFGNANVCADGIVTCFRETARQPESIFVL